MVDKKEKAILGATCLKQEFDQWMTSHMSSIWKDVEGSQFLIGTNQQPAASSFFCWGGAMTISSLFHAFWIWEIIQKADLFWSMQPTFSGSRILCQCQCQWSQISSLTRLAREGALVHPKWTSTCAGGCRRGGGARREFLHQGTARFAVCWWCCLAIWPSSSCWTNKNPRLVLVKTKIVACTTWVFCFFFCFLGRFLQQQHRGALQLAWFEVLL